MAAPALNERLHRDAIKTLLDQALDPWEAYDIGRVPGALGSDGTPNPGHLPDIWVQITLERRYAQVVRTTARASRSGWRLLVRGVGRTTDESRHVLNAATRALEGTRLVVEGRTSTPLAYATSGAIKPDDGRFSGHHEYTYAF